MTTNAAADQLEAITHLPPGGRLILSDVNWGDYEELLSRIGDSSHFRTSYSNGRLEVMSPSTKHEKYKNLISWLVAAVCDELGVDVISFGSFTMKIDRLRMGAEADDCFYLRRMQPFAGEDGPQLGTDPPPDLVVEIDITADSRNKLDIYGSLGVPEVWRYDGSRLSVFQLIEGSYVSSEHSLCFSFLSADRLTEILAGVSTGTHESWRVLREWIRANKPTTA
ncbi:MAG TPA: Uma2 family endonuclease [Blastocatellia bacterium]|nr:Uma2 family endonuclease [Blastocatellia bacterium]